MDVNVVLRAWKDPEYRASLDAVTLNQIPEHPSGSPLRELELDQLSGVAGGHLSCKNSCYSANTSCGWICTYTTECGCVGPTCSVVSDTCCTGSCPCYGHCD
jgi:mersacidin/lichenicidin family type 2 lantibiotic